MSAGDVDLKQLVVLCLKRRVSAHVFNSLFKQLNHKNEVTISDLVSLLSAQDEFDPLLASYLTAVATEDQSTNLKLCSLLDNLPNAIEANQYLLLNSLTNTFRDERFKTSFPFNSFEVNDLITSITSYVKTLLEKQPQSYELLESLSYFLNVFFEIIPFEVPPLTQEQNDLLASVLNEVKQKNAPLAEFLESNMIKSLKKSSIVNIRQSVSLPSSSLQHAVHSSFLKTNKLPKFIWLNLIIQNWSSNSSKSLSSFEQFVKVKTNQNVLNELISLSFECITIALQSRDASDLVIKNWKLFLTKRLPLLIKELNLKNVESSLSNALNLIDPKISKTIKLNSSGGSDPNDDDIFSSFPSTNTDIRHDFLRSCIALKLLPQSAFAAILKEDAQAENRNLPTSDDVLQNGQPIDISTTLHATLIDINPEFIPLEDSGLLEFFSLVEEMEGTKQVELSNLILETINEFIKNDDVSHLYRLALALGLSPSALHAILFHLSPSAFLKPLLSFLDKWQVSNDDMNFQDVYSAFGCVLMLFLLIVKDYKISFESLLLMKDNPNEPSFCIKYLTKLGSLSQFDSSNTHQSDLLNGWITALFDSGGISDDLMRLSTVQECFQLFPVIFQQAFIACKQGLIDEDTVKGGLEYFLQPFLLSTIVGILSWSETFLWKRNDVDLLINLIKTLINPLDLSGESVHIHKFVLSIYGPNLFHLLSEINKNPQTPVDPILLSSLRQSVGLKKPTYFFEFDTSPTFMKYFRSILYDINKKTDVQASPLSLFHTQFNTLLNWSQTTIVPNYDFQLFSTLLEVLGEETMLDYFLDQIFEAQNLNSKPSQTILELSTFLLATHYVESSVIKDFLLNCLKQESLTDDRYNSISPSCKFAKVLIDKKKSILDNEAIENEVVQLFYEKFIESVQTIVPLK